MIVSLNSTVSATAVTLTFSPERRLEYPFFRVVVLGDERKRNYEVRFDASLPVGELHETLRRAAACVVKMLREEKRDVLHLAAGSINAQLLLAFVDGLHIADYSFDRYKAKTPLHLKQLFITSSKLRERTLDEYRNVWNRLFWCREWVNMPVADLNAPRFADELQAVADDLHVDCQVFGRADIERMHMGGLMAVNRGSVDEPRLVVLEYNGLKGSAAKTSHPIALVGKGIMYDTGGLNIKPNDYMQEMKSDMAGAATMASVLFTAADNRLPVHLVAVLPMTDNRPGFNAYAADDILTMHDGTTVEVVNTDAEGRLILADALSYAVRHYKPQLVIDAATLTGAAVRAIATFGIAAIEQNAKEPMLRMQEVGETVHQRIALLPFWKEYDAMLHSDVADLKNCGPGQAGTITAGKFLAHFVGRTPYIHLDIAGVAFFSKAQAPYATGASGYALRLLYEFLKTC